MSHLGSVVLLAAAALCGQLVTAEKASQDGDSAERLRAVAERAFEELDLPGMAVEVAVGEETLLRGGWGYSDAEAGAAAAPDAPFRAGSLTVQLVALCALRLADDGALSLDDQLSTYFEDLEFEGAEITLRHLLEHSSGLPASNDAMFALGGEGAPTLAQIIAWLPTQPLYATPGECSSPTGIETILLGAVLEQVTEARIPDLVTAWVFAPLDLEDTLYRTDGPPLRDEAISVLELGGAVVEDELLSSFFDARGLCTTAEDLTRLTRGVLEREVVSEEGFSFLTEPRRLPDGTPVRITAGFSRTSLGGFDGISLGGGMAGCRVHAAWYEPLDLSIAVLASADYAPVAVIERRLARSFLGLADPSTADLPLPEEARRKYIGGYFVGCSRYLVVAEEGRLWIAPPDGPSFKLLRQGEHAFQSADDPDVHVTFQVEDDLARSFTLYDHGTATVATRMD